jgi:hypothetical protein
VHGQLVNLRESYQKLPLVSHQESNVRSCGQFNYPAVPTRSI